LGNKDTHDDRHRIHNSIPKGTIIEFVKDKTWKSSESIENSKTGKWSLENDDRTLSMTFNKSEKEFLVLDLTADQFPYRLSRLGAVYTFEWLAKQ